ncbi:MAG TPA: hypothetical protein PKB09_03685 [Candidatus Saccharibacteria bacterium]|nr:hypothetical protein [Candidatus Saccharibacteria bacterium]
MIKKEGPSSLISQLITNSFFSRSVRSLLISTVFFLTSTTPPVSVASVSVASVSILGSSKGLGASVVLATAGAPAV